ncbi:Protein MSP1 isoform A [Senna tora]|uniref:Protein MSP1 isoform A n=1 Tax=Senna tora TaxID=362788 RepID=A0A834W3N7_9FABA|nr:Protein MSP1 isoform A [Senna tora]
MYLRRIQRRDWRWGVVFQPSKYFTRPQCYGHACFQSQYPKTKVEEYVSYDSINRRRLLGSFLSRCASSSNSCTDLNRRPSLYLKSTQLRVYSSESDGRNASEDKHVNVNDGSNCDKVKNWQDKFGEDAKLCKAHARLGEQDQEEWLNNEKASIENKRRESPFLSRRDKFKNEFLRRVVPWEKINISWDTFPYYIHENTKNLLVECVASHLRHKKCTSSYGARLSSSGGRILLQSIPGTELYRERLVRALAQDLEVPLLVLDNSILAPYYIDDDLSSECESDDDNAESGEEGSLDSEDEDDNDASNEEEWTSSTEAKSDVSDNEERDAIASAEAALKKVKAAVEKLVPYNVEDFEKRSSEESENSDSTKSEDVKPSDHSGCQIKKGDRVKYIGPSVQVEADNRGHKVTDSYLMGYQFLRCMGGGIGWGRREEMNYWCDTLDGSMLLSCSLHPILLVSFAIPQHLLGRRDPVNIGHTAPTRGGASGACGLCRCGGNQGSSCSGGCDSSNNIMVHWIILGKILTSDGPSKAYTIIHGRALSNGQRGEVYEVNGDQVAVILDFSENNAKEGEMEKTYDKHIEPKVHWIHETRISGKVVEDLKAGRKDTARLQPQHLYHKFKGTMEDKRRSEMVEDDAVRRFR